MSATSRSVYRDTVLIRRDGDGALVPLSGAEVYFYVANGPDHTPLPYPLYPSSDATTPLALPFVTGDKGEVEVWSDTPTRARQLVFYRGVPSSDEYVDIVPSVGNFATDQEVANAVAIHAQDESAHPWFLTEPEGDLRYLPLSHQPGVDPHPQYLQASVFNQADPLPQYQQESERGQANGYAPLDPNGLLPTAHLPPLAITNTFVVADEAEMLALDAQVGDLAIRTDTSKSYILAAEPASTLTNWKELSAAAPVLSVDGRTGVVDLSDRYVDTAGDTLTGLLTTTYGPLQPSATAGNRLTWTGDGLFVPPALDQAAGDLRYLQLSGGALSGPLTIQTKPVDVSPDAGNILQWLPNGFFAGLSSANVTVVRREEFSPAATATSVTLAAAPTTVLEVSRNGVAQSAALGHYTVAGTVVTFVDAFVAGEQVLVLYELGTSIPTDTYTKSESDARYVNVTGDTVTGPVTMQADVYFDGVRYVLPLVTGQGWVGTGSNAFEGVVAAKGYFTNELWYQGTKLEDRYVDVGGDSMSGALTMSGAPVNARVPSGMAGFQVFQDAEASARFQARGDGALYFGPGGATAVDITLSRTNAGTLLLASTRARLAAQATGATTRARFGQEYAGSGTILSDNLYTDAVFGGSGWGKDDTTKGGWWLALNDGYVTLAYSKPGANPATNLMRAQWGPTGTLTLAPEGNVSALTATGDNGTAQSILTPNYAEWKMRRSGGDWVRIGQHAGGHYAAWTVNASHNGSQWVQDDGAKPWDILQFNQGNGGIQYSFGRGGTNPAGIPKIRFEVTERGLGLPNCRGDADGAGAAPYYGLDVSQAVSDDTVTLGHSLGFHPFNGGLFSGLFIINNVSSGTIGVFLQGGGIITLVSQTGTEYVVNAPGTSGKTCVYFDAGYNIAVVNNLGATHGYRVFAIRTRSNA